MKHFYELDRRLETVANMVFRQGFMYGVSSTSFVMTIAFVLLDNRDFFVPLIIGVVSFAIATLIRYRVYKIKCFEVTEK